MEVHVEPKRSVDEPPGRGVEVVGRRGFRKAAALHGCNWSAAPRIARLRRVTCIVALLHVPEIQSRTVSPGSLCEDHTQVDREEFGVDRRPASGTRKGGEISHESEARGTFRACHLAALDAIFRRISTAFDQHPDVRILVVAETNTFDFEALADHRATLQGGDADRSLLRSNRLLVNRKELVFFFLQNPPRKITLI